ncbi:3-isopropylmalate dehydrogenase [Buchnera aphidicola]|uniref:3-isopropylmalate dehydrogenase n=1 Tax=Buchnera aphidicola (Sarucallis kahawaluokalani) TaxID=1241878 RepID=A0A4D6YI39_9GAMM|nr:3-isopropylmalate dehydrogenase [Buchnera aphidicola]QCI26021.1 3-isopropylmalate dehydrogenase [Buchnera aphidicola (Sarucallis kahawaluokalani)]
MKKKFHLAILPGDGIGPEVMQEAYKIIHVLKSRCYINFILHEYDIGGIALEKYGIALPKKTLTGCEKSDAILLGSVGGPEWSHLPDDKQPERGALLPLRKHFNLFANLRPAILYPELKDLSPLRKNIIQKGIDILCVRELTGGIYFGKSGRKYDDQLHEFAFDTECYYTREINRIAKIAFEIAQKRKKKLTSIDKSNVLISSKLWRDTVNNISKRYPDVRLSHLYIDNAVMQIIKNPNQFDVILCSNLFGDILSDACAEITGSIGMLASASLNEKNFGMYEPAGGSAPDIKGKNIANPIAQILSVALLLRYSMKLYELSDAIFESVKQVLKKGYRTIDIANNSNDYITTNQMGDIITKMLIKEI